MKKIIFELEEDIKKEFRKYCIEKGTSMSDVLRELIKGLLVYHRTKRIDG